MESFRIWVARVGCDRQLDSTAAEEKLRGFWRTPLCFIIFFSYFESFFFFSSFSRFSGREQWRLELCGGEESQLRQRELKFRRVHRSLRLLSNWVENWFIKISTFSIGHELILFQLTRNFWRVKFTVLCHVLRHIKTRNARMCGQKFLEFTTDTSNGGSHWLVWPRNIFSQNRRHALDQLLLTKVSSS